MMCNKCRSCHPLKTKTNARYPVVVVRSLRYQCNCFVRCSMEVLAGYPRCHTATIGMSRYRMVS